MNTDPNCKTRQKAFRSPIADALLTTRQMTLSSFHALPIANGSGYRGSPLETLFETLFKGHMGAEVSVTCSSFDSLCHPTRCVRDSEQLTAEAFGADGSLFGTAGTTLSNQIVLEAVTERRGLRALADKNLHQSLHFGLRDQGYEIDYVDPTTVCDQSERFAFSLRVACEALARAEQDGAPYHIVVLTAQTYEGVIMDMRTVLPALMQASPSLKYILADEAWGSWSYFSQDIRPMTTMSAAATMPETDNGIGIIATQSVHKSLCAMRQASQILYTGPASLGKKLRAARYRLHTTSPNSAILASIDLARAQMVIEGAELTARSSDLARDLCVAVASDPRLEGCEIVVPNMTNRDDASHVVLDPTKVCLGITGLNISGAELREILYDRFGIYVSRCSESVVVFNFHIGVRSQDVDRLIAALVEICADNIKADPSAISNAYIIPYPPGVPLVVPGEIITAAMQGRIARAKRAGATVFSVSQK